MALILIHYDLTDKLMVFMINFVSFLKVLILDYKIQIQDHNNGKHTRLTFWFFVLFNTLNANTKYTILTYKNTHLISLTNLLYH